MLRPLLLSRRSQTTAAWIIILVGSLFLLTGCAQLYKLVGLTQKQTDEQVSEDQKTIIKTITITRNTAADIITTAIAGIGAIVSGFLAKWLGTERKLTKALITGVEAAGTAAVKPSIQRNASAAGVEKKLHARVRALT